MAHAMMLFPATYRPWRALRHGGIARFMASFTAIPMAALVAALAILPAPARAVAVGDTVQLPAVTLIDGRTLGPETWRGKPVVIQIWATWCPFCAMQNPRLQKMYAATRNTPLQVLTVSIDPKPETVREYVAQRKYTFPVTMSNPTLKQAIGAHRGIPEVIVLDRNGRVVLHEIGEMLEEDVAELAKYATQ
ncbi:TlpA disulfide reductase family protein [Imbroritus primus]